MKSFNPSIDELGQALFIVNRHAKTAPDPSNLYQLKNEALKKLISEKKALKVGLHFSGNPKNTYQHSVLLVKIGDYYFHTLPSKNDMRTLQHLGHLKDNYRNPKSAFSLSRAKKILNHYLDGSVPNKDRKKKHSRYSVSSTELSPFYHKRKHKYK